MNIKEFISETLNQIIEGVTEAQKNNTSNASISGSHVSMKNISFDIAVVTESSENKGNKAGIKVAELVSFGKNSDIKSQESTTSRIKFEIPISLPYKDRE